MDGIQNISNTLSNNSIHKMLFKIQNIYIYIYILIYKSKYFKYNEGEGEGDHTIKFFSNCKLHQNTLLKMLLTFKKIQIIENTKHLLKYQYKGSLNFSHRLNPLN